MSSPPTFVSGLSVLAARYPALVCDVWGVVHNGVAPFPGAVEALGRYRAAGGVVALVTNAPRPGPSIERQLARIGVPRDTYDDVITAGDVTIDMLRAHGRPPALHIGPDRDASLFRAAGAEPVGEAEAGIVVATGLVDDETEHPDDYRPLLERLAARRLPFLCANPDIVVERGDSLVWCAGALASIYAELGGETVLLGKPYPAIYAAARRLLAARAGRPLESAEILAVGDGLATDVTGACRDGLDVLFVTSGIHAADFGDVDSPDPTLVAQRLAADGLAVRYVIPRLAW